MRNKTLLLVKISSVYLLDEIYYEEAFDILKSILSFFENEYGEMNHLVGECHVSLSLVLMRGNNIIARDSLKKVKNVCNNLTIFRLMIFIVMFLENMMNAHRN
jgi:hypothetical protein